MRERYLEDGAVDQLLKKYENQRCKGKHFPARESMRDYYQVASEEIVDEPDLDCVVYGMFDMYTDLITTQMKSEQISALAKDELTKTPLAGTLNDRAVLSILPLEERSVAGIVKGLYFQSSYDSESLTDGESFTEVDVGLWYHDTICAAMDMLKREVNEEGEKEDELRPGEHDLTCVEGLTNDLTSLSCQSSDCDCPVRRMRQLVLMPSRYADGDLMTQIDPDAQRRLAQELIEVAYVTGLTTPEAEIAFHKKSETTNEQS